MNYRLLYLVLLLFPVAAFSQKALPRELLHGRVVADSLMTDYLSVSNITSRISAVTDVNGYFTLYARPTDTLYFFNVTFRTAQLVLKESDFLEDPLFIKLEPNVIVLDEVVIKPSVLTGILDKDSKKKKTMTITAGMGTAEELNRYAVEPARFARVNGTLPPDMGQMNGVNLVRIYDMYFRKRNKKKDKGEIYNSGTASTFPEVAKARFTYHFFTETLHIPQDEIGLFLNFSDDPKATAPLLDPKKEFELTDYLVQKSKEYLAAKK